MDWSTYIPIYVRSTGNDTNSGLTTLLPVATVQHAYDIAYGMSGNIVLDLDTHTYTGIRLTADWPSRIGIRGVSASTSLLGGLNANGTDDDYSGNGNALNGFNVTLTSDNTVNLGSVSNLGGMGGTGDSLGWGPTNPGALALTGCTTLSISNDGNGSTGEDQSSGGGSVALTFSKTGYISSVGGNGDGVGGGGGSVQLINSTSGNISVDGGTDYYAGGGGGYISLLNSNSGNLSVNGGTSESGEDYNGGSGGTIILNASYCGSISLTPGTPLSGSQGPNPTLGTVTVSNCHYTAFPSWINYATFVSTTNTFTFTYSALSTALSLFIQSSKLILPFADVLGGGLL